MYEPELKKGCGIRLDIGGRPGNPVLMPTLIQSLRLIRETGVGKINSHCQELYEHMRKGLAGIKSIDVLMPVKSAPHLFGLKVIRKGDGEDLTEKLYDFLLSGEDDGIVVNVSYRSGHVRVGLYGYNTKNEVDVVVGKLASFGEKIIVSYENEKTEHAI